MAALAAVQCPAYPIPDPVATRWEFACDIGELRIATLPTGEDGEREAYWYFTYTVTNETDKDLQYAPSFVMYDSEGDLRQSGAPAEATRGILALLDDPLVEDELSIGGTLLQGEANAKSGVVIWPVASAAVDRITIFVGNISGEAVIETDPATNEPVVLRKTLAVSYETPGEVIQLLAVGAISEPDDLLWIMR